MSVVHLTSKDDQLRFFQVVDFYFKKDVPPETVAEIRRPFSLDTVPQSIPEQNPETCRVYFEQGFLEESDFDADTRNENNRAELDEVQRRVVQLIPHSWPYWTRESSPLLAAALSECRRYSSAIPGWAINLKSDQQPISRETIAAVRWRERDYGPLALMKEYLAGAIQWRIQARFLWDQDRAWDDRITLLVSWKRLSGAFSRGWADDVKSRTVHRMIQLDARNKILEGAAGLKTEDHSTLILLRLCHAVFLQHVRSLDNLRPWHISLLDALSEPNVNISSSFLQCVTESSSHFEKLHHNFENLRSIIEALLDILAPSWKESDDFKLLDLELRNMGRNLSLASSSLAPRLDNRLRFLEISRNIRESSSLWLLSLLAGIFLPLSLASSLLSMQSRLFNLHYLLYDFCGVIVLFGTLAVAIVQLIRQLAKRKGNIYYVFHIRRWYHWVFILSEWALVLSSFLVGMFKDVGFGLKILGYGTAILGLPYSLVICAMIYPPIRYRLDYFFRGLRFSA